MPLGEFIGEVLLRGILEAIVYGVLYYTGAPFLAVFSVGRLDLAPLSSLETVNRGKTRWTDWSIWLQRPGRRKALRAEAVCLAGLIVWAGVGLGAFLMTRDGEVESGEAEKAQSEVTSSQIPWLG
jgi:hypothetical protein